MLRHDVVEAVSKKQFHIYTVKTVNDALELLMGMDIGVSDDKGNYKKGTINHRVVERLEELHTLHGKYALSNKGKG